MKNKIRYLLPILTLLLLMSSFASTETIKGTLKRKIKTKPVKKINKVLDGISSTTGLSLSDKPYIPMLLQIDNNRAALPQWGLSYADIIYEMPIQGRDFTRLTALFSDQYPEEAGPVRSGRVLHADLREEWDAMFLFYGKQEVAGSDLKETLSKYGVFKKGLAVDGTGNKFDGSYFLKTRYHYAPHNVSAQVKKLNEYTANLKYNFKERPFLFTDELPSIGNSANQILIKHKNNTDTAAVFEYDSGKNKYTRHTSQGPFIDLLYSNTAIEYANIIVQRTKLSFNNGASKPLLKQVVGSGAAEIFMGGKYIAGMWSRKDLKSRTVFFDSEGNELQLQRGKTWIVVCDTSTDVSYNANPINTDDFFKIRKSLNKLNIKTKTNQQETASPSPIEGFKFKPNKNSAIAKHYTSLRIPGIEQSVYCFVDKNGEFQFRVYGQIQSSKTGYYPVELNLLEGDVFELKLLQHVPSADRTQFAVYKGVDLEKDSIPAGFKKAAGKGMYYFVNIFGRKEFLSHAKRGEEEANWYFAAGKKPLAGSVPLDFAAIEGRMSSSGKAEFKTPKELGKGYAVSVNITTSNGKSIQLMTAKPEINKDILNPK